MRIFGWSVVSTDCGRGGQRCCAPGRARSLGFRGEVGGKDGFPLLLSDCRGDGGIAEAGETVDLDGTAFEADDYIDLGVGLFDAERVARAEAERGGFTGVDGFAEGFGEALDLLGVGDAGGAENWETVKHCG